jgi:pimeloyl-ACP methyl ester carboxylesterase
MPLPAPTLAAPAFLLLAAGTSGCDSGGSLPDEDDNTDDDGTWHAPCPSDEREQRILPVGELSLNVACREDGPTVVFLHGFPEFPYAWNSVMDELVDEYRLVAPNQRGYNLSDKPEDGADYELQMVVDSLELIGDCR